MIKKYLPSLRKWRGLLLVITAVVLLELLSGVQYYYAHNLMEEHLEKNAFGELRTKAILIKSTLNSAEDILHNHVYEFSTSLSDRDKIEDVLKQMVLYSRQVRGSFVCFRPDYYPDKDRLFEIYALRRGSETMGVEWKHLGGESHDYTQSEFYNNAMVGDGGRWAAPYMDNEGAEGMVTSYVLPLKDTSEELAGVVGIDISLDWLRDTIDMRHLFPSSFVMLLSEEGKPVIKPSEDRVSLETQDRVIRLINDSTVSRKQVFNGRGTMIDFEAEGREGSIIYTYMKGIPRWRIAVVCYDDEVYATLSELRLKLLFFSVLAFGIMLFVVWLFVRGEKRLQTKTLEKERMDGELRIASGIQQTLLPVYAEALAGVDDVKVQGRLIPAKAVGGDLYNVFVRDGKLFFCIGDVSGKGVPAAIIMAIEQAMFYNIASRNDNPAHILDRLNESGCRNNKANIFVTMFIGVLDLPTGHLRYSNAGHELPILLREKAGFIDAKPNLPIGLFNDFHYEMQETVMQPGTTLFLYTDGITEAKSVNGEMFGRDRLVSLLENHDNTDVKTLVDDVIAEVQRFAEMQSDDLTLLAIRYTPKREQLVFDETLTLPNDVKEVTRLSAFIKDVMARLDIPKPLASKMRLALEEAVVNVMEYAYPAGTKGNVVIRVTCSTDRQLKFIITDAGVAFNPTETATADTTLSVEERPVGGLGILLVRELMDTVNYERTDGKNVLTLTKNISS